MNRDKPPSVSFQEVSQPDTARPAFSNSIVTAKRDWLDTAQQGKAFI